MIPGTMSDSPHENNQYATEHPTSHRESTGHVRRLSRGTAEAMLSGVVTDGYLAAAAAAGASAECDESILSGGSNKTGGSRGSKNSRGGASFTSRGSKNSLAGNSRGSRRASADMAPSRYDPESSISRYDPESMERVEVGVGALSDEPSSQKHPRAGSGTFLDVPDVGDDGLDESLRHSAHNGDHDHVGHHQRPHRASQSSGSGGSTPRQSGGGGGEARQHEIGGREWQDDEEEGGDDERVRITVDRPFGSQWDKGHGEDGSDAWGIDVEEESYAVRRTGPVPPNDPNAPSGNGDGDGGPHKVKGSGLGSWRSACAAEGNVDRDITRAKWALVAMCFIAAISLFFVDIYDAVEAGEAHLGVGGHHRPTEEPQDGGGNDAEGTGGAEPTTADESSAAPALEISGGQMPSEPPEPPSDLHFTCSFTSVSLSESSYGKCEQACLKAECCFLAASHVMSCDKGDPGEEYCQVYKSNCMVLDKNWSAGEGDEGANRALVGEQGLLFWH